MVEQYFEGIEIMVGWLVCVGLIVWSHVRQARKMGLTMKEYNRLGRGYQGGNRGSGDTRAPGCESSTQVSSSFDHFSSSGPDLTTQITSPAYSYLPYNNYNEH